MLARLIIGIILMGVTIFDFAFFRPAEDSWTKETTFYFVKTLYIGFLSIVLIVTSATGE